MKLSIVVPCYNEQEGIRTTHARLAALAAGWRQAGKLDDVEIVYVDDGSADSTLQILDELAAGDPTVRVISFTRNFGHQAALAAGLENATGDAVVTLDADLQDPPETIEPMLEKIREGYDVVFGVRRSRQKDTAFKRSTARLFYRLMAAMGVNLIYDHADFRMVRREVIDAFLQYQERNLFLRGLFPALGFRQCEVEYDRQERQAGETKYPLRKMVNFAVEGITSFSYVPLRLSLMLGILVFLASLAGGAWWLVAEIVGWRHGGWTSLLPIYGLCGLQMIFIGILGEYVGRIYMEVKRRPRFIVRRRNPSSGGTV